MENGLYEKVIDEIIKEKLKGKGFKETRSIDDSELPQVLATTYQKKIRETLAQISGKDEKIEFINRLNNTIGIGSFDYSDEKFRELLTVHENEEFYKELKELRPKTSISTSTLFIGYTGPTLESELRREIRTADEINLLVSFIKFSGLRLIYEDLVEFTKRNKLRVITTSYMGASDYKAILELSKLPNTGAKIFTGNLIPEGAEPISQAYAGHQFGHFTMLGDGRASLIGEHVTPKGERYDIQLKGSGRTRYSRGGDGRAALGPMLREYIISGGLHGLGIPTTRSLAVATTREEVPREDYLTGAILTRVASSHIRVGTFQFISAYGSPEDLRSLAEYTIQRHFPNISENEDKYLLLLKEVVTKQAKLIAKWQLIGFVHGVMNTDNMTISGESIDFGPCAFVDTYNPRTVFSSIDRQGRYAYGNQPDIGAWNLSRFADTLLPLIHDNQEEAIEIATEQVSEFYNIYNDSWLNGMRAKLGLFNRETQDQDIIEELFTLMEKYKADFTNTFRSLTIDQLEDMELFNTDEFNNWKSKWKNRLDKQTQTQEEIRKLMKENNPSVIPRNHRVEEALMAAVERDDLSVMKKLLIALENPYAYTTHQEQYSTLPPSSYESYTTFCGT